MNAIQFIQQNGVVRASAQGWWGMRLSRLSLAMLIAKPLSPIKGFYLPDARLNQ